jgi:hypothetical protein
MLEGSFKYYKDCESYQKVKEVQLIPNVVMHLSLVQGRFVIGVYALLANCISHFGEASDVL